MSGIVEMFEQSAQARLRRPDTTDQPHS